MRSSTSFDKPIYAAAAFFLAARQLKVSGGDDGDHRRIRDLMLLL